MGTAYTMPIFTETFKGLLHEMLLRNELEGDWDKGFKITNPPTSNSGYSFGPSQWDLKKNSDARRVLIGILENAKDSNNNLIFDPAKLAEIKQDGKVTYEEVSQIIAQDRETINRGLQSEYGVQKINNEYVAHIDKEITRLNTLCTELEDAGRQAVANYIRSNTLMQMMLIDFDNQFGIDGVDGNQTDPVRAKLMHFLKTGETTLNYGQKIKVVGEFDIVDYLEFVFSTEYAHNFDANGVKDLLRRFCNTAKTLQEYGEVPLTAEEQKIVEGLKSLYGLNISSRELFEKVHNFFTIAATGAGSPIVLDLDGDGVETTNVKDGAYFDQDGNGFAEQTGWAASDDGILVRDINGNGSIDNGKELFGDHTLLGDGTRASNGFQALAELDDNLDGKIDANDAAFSQLKVWKDIDGDGYSSADELESLSDAGVTSINTGYTDSILVDAQGNEHRQVGSFTKTDGAIWFKKDTAYTIATEWLDVPPEIAALPDLQGYGNVYDLQQAVVRNASGVAYA